MKKASTSVDIGENSNNAPSPTPPSNPLAAPINPTTVPITSTNIANKPAQEEEEIPRDAYVMEKILESMGIKEFEPRIIEQLLELVHRN